MSNSIPIRPLVPCPGTVRIWHSSTYRLESTLNYGMERVWCVCGLRGSNNVALGYDEGSIIIKVTRAKGGAKISSLITSSPRLFM